MNRKEFIPRPWQVPMLAHVMEHERCALWAGMGLGKTVVVETFLDALYLGGESHPTLILGPLRVARKVWSDEARKWEHLRTLAVTPIIGSEKDRLTALRLDTPVYTTNYENLIWLIEHFGDRWPFRTVIPDESDYVKGHRISDRQAMKRDGSLGKQYQAGQGSKRAGALARIAHTKIKRFIELTGTPAPNGLIDLWGQLWYLDRGARLGTNFTAFKQRFFRPSYDGYGSEPLETADAQIHAAVKDICLTIDGADWFDLAKPIVNNVYVDLSAKARKLYKEMEDEMYLEIEGRSAEAFGAAARTQKLLQLCLAKGTEVLTDSGWLPIENVSVKDYLWDGEEWVSNCGAVYNGVQDVVVCDGVTMTPDHQLLTKNGWATAREVLDNEQDTRYDRLGVWLPDDIGAGGLRVCRGYASRYVASEVRLRKGTNRPRELYPFRTSGTNEVVRLPPGRDVDRCLGHAWDDYASGVPLVGRDAATLREQEGERLGQLWCTWDYRLRKMARVLRKLLGRYGGVLSGRMFDRSGEQRARVLPGELSVGDTKDSREQHPREQGARYLKGEADHEASSGGVWSTLHNTARSFNPVRLRRRAGSDEACKAPVYDILNAGPRNRFVIRSPSGKLLISHNCNGAIYLDPLVGNDDSPRAKEWRLVHDEKIEALESIVHETAGAALLVCYEFKSDLARLVKAFPKGRVLKNQKDEDDFKAGKVPILFLHPKSGGHGIDGFQHACNNIVFFGFNWSLGQRLQVIERIGPIRQMQAGLERPVFIHNIIARNTVDELVLERHETKREVLDLLLDACKRRK